MAFSFMSAFIRSIILGILGVLEYRIMASQRKQRAELVEANEKLTHYALTIEQLTVSRERNRMARELHDTLAHTLSSVAVELEAVKTLVKPKPAEALKLVDQSLGITRNGLNETRKALQDLRALPIEDLGLTLALEDPDGIDRRAQRDQGKNPHRQGDGQDPTGCGLLHLPYCTGGAGEYRPASGAGKAR